MRALFYLSAPEWSGAARAFAEAARRLAAAGSQVTVACPPESPVEERMAALDLTVDPVEPGGPFEHRRLRRVLLDRFVEVTFVHTEREHWAAALASRAAGRGAVVRRTPAGARLDAGWITRLAVRRAASSFLFASPGELQAAPAVRGAHEPRVAELGVELADADAVRPSTPQELGIEPGTRPVVCVCGVGARARAATALRTVALLAPRHPKLRLVLVGAGSDDEDLRMHAAALHVTSIVKHLGERDDQTAVLRAAALGWVVADGDDAAFAALDLMAAGVPVIAEHGSVAHRYVADGVGGVVTAPGDAAESAAAIAGLLASAERRHLLGATGRERVERDYTARRMADGFAAAVEAARDRSRWIA